MSNQTCTGREILCSNRQCVRLHNVKHRKTVTRAGKSTLDNSWKWITQVSY